MPGRPIASLAAIGLLLVIGLCGIAVGIELFVAMSSPTVASLPIGTEPAGGLLVAGIAGYGALAVAGGVGMFARRRWAWWLALGTIVAGLVMLVWVLLVAGLDQVTLSGLLIWGLTVALLLAPGTRRAMSG